MPGSAVLGTSLIDQLVPDVVDGLRGELHPEFGNRAYRVFTIRRSWSGPHSGQGSKTDIENEITPQPFVKPWRSFKYELEPCGLEESGLVELIEVSLTYTEAELIGPRDDDQVGALKKNEQWLWRIDEAHGQLTKSKYFTVDKPPYIDRENTIGWIVWLRSA